jgi:hypothetical protein
MSDDQPNKRQKLVDSAPTDHSYKDYSNVPILQGALLDSSISAVCHTSAAFAFPAKLHEILSNPEYEHIISWRPHGRSWEVKDRKLLVSVVLKKHFNHSNYESFNRQVNIWGFKVRCNQSTAAILSAKHHRANRSHVVCPTCLPSFGIY